MTNLDVGLFLLPEESPERTIELIELCEEVGLSSVGVADSHMLWDDVYVILGAAAQRTSRIRLGPWVTNSLTRHETVTTNAIATLNALSGGRAFLGIGYGDSAVKTIGMKPQRLLELVASVDRMRALAAGATIETETGKWWIKTAPGDFYVYWAADGPRSLEDAGRYGDGVVANGLLVPEHMDFMKSHILRGARSRSRPVGEPEIVFNTGIAIDDDGRKARNIAKPYLARTLCHDVSEWMPGWDETAANDFRARYDYYHHIDAEHEIAALVPDELVTRKAIAGTPQECADLVRLVKDNGFDRLMLLVLGDSETTIRRLADEVLPRVTP
jgi:5,10-methylenetetrahydromethanopterin reductase